MFASEFSNGLDNLETSETSTRKQNSVKLLLKNKNYTFPSQLKKQGNKLFKENFLSLLSQETSKTLNLNAKHVKPIEEPLFSSKSFRDFLEFHPHMIANLEQTLHVTQVTSVQELAIPVIINGKDVLIRSQTGSGKTLAYAIPVIEKLHKILPKLSRKDGLKVLIILPTRELAVQTYEWFVKLVKPFTWIVPGLLIGGEKRKSEKARLRKGITVLIGTPGRLLDHAKNTQCVTFQHLNCLIIDEADRLLELGYEKDVTSLIEMIDSQIEQRRQTVLLSATLTKQVEKLAVLSLYEPERIDVSLNSKETIDTLVIPNTLTQYYIVVPPKLRLVTLAAILTDKCSSKEEGKILVFMGTQAMVDYHTELFSTVLSDINFYKLHGKMSQVERTDVFKSFRSYDSGVLLCSDVAARGLDLPQVDWIIQYTAPVSSHDYVHRVGRTARVGSKGTSILFLAPHEMNFVSMLYNQRVKITEDKIKKYMEKLIGLNFDEKNLNEDTEYAVSKLQKRFETALLDQKLLHSCGCEAFVSWARFYASYPKEVQSYFNFKQLHLGHYAKSFAIKDPPKVISGIGKPKRFTKSTVKRKVMKNNKEKPLKRNAPLMTETLEFESGLHFKRKKRKCDR